MEGKDFLRGSSLPGGARRGSAGPPGLSTDNLNSSSESSESSSNESSIIGSTNNADKRKNKRTSIPCSIRVLGEKPILSSPNCSATDIWNSLYNFLICDFMYYVLYILYTL